VQPYHGAKQNGILGFFSGILIGLGGFVLKDISAFVGPPAYTLKGLHQEVRKGKQPTACLKRARIVQGQKDLKHLDKVDLMPKHFDPEKSEKRIVGRKEVEKEVLSKWKVVQKEIEAEKTKMHSTVRGRLGFAPGEKKGGKDVPRKEKARKSLDTSSKLSKKSKEVEREKV
jgi:hypothetical protein